MEQAHGSLERRKMANEDVEFAIKVTNVHWVTREVIETLLELEECNDLREATTLAERSLDQLRDLIISRYTNIVQSMEVRTTLDTREERIKMQGGI
jgi:hypothetical protein